MTIPPDHISDDRAIRLTGIIADHVVRIGYLALAAFVAHRSLGFPDLGVSAVDLFWIGVGGALSIYVVGLFVQRRAIHRICNQLRSDGVSETDRQQFQRRLKSSVWSDIRDS